MKKLIYIVSIMLLVGCSTEIDVLQEGEPTPIVYCLLNPDSSAQKLRLSKSFINPRLNEYPDSMEMINYQGKVNLAIEHVVNDVALTHSEFQPQQVAKDSGYFPGGYHTVYTAQTMVQENETYRLVIYIPESDRLVYAYTTVLGDFFLVDPNYPEVRKLHLLPENYPVFHWTPAENANIYQIAMTLHYLEMDSVSSVKRSTDIPLKTLIKWDDPGIQYSFEVNPNILFNKLSDLIPLKPDVSRAFLSIDTHIIAGAHEIAVMFQNETQQDPFRVVDYSNLVNAVGIFSSVKYKSRTNFDVTDRSLDSLAYSDITYELNFLDSDGHRKQ